MEHKNYNAIHKSVRKKDSMQLLLGKPVYTDDITGPALVVKLLRSPHANAIVEEIHTEIAKKIPGVVDIYTWEDVPKTRFAIAGQTYPEPSPYDRLIIDRHVRFVGDVVAIIAAEDEKAACKAMKLVKVKYNVLEPVLDFHKAKDNPVLVHPEDDWYPPVDVGGDAKRNVIAHELSGDGDVDAVISDCEVSFSHAYHMRAFNQAMMETFRTYTCLDRYGRLHVISSTQIVFHVRRILSRALGIPKSKIRVEKPRIGGGFGAKQTAVSEVYPAFVTMQTGRPAKLIFTRYESQIAGSPRHEMEVTVRLGADRDGHIRGLDLYTLSNTGAYGEHGPTTVGLSGHKSIPLYTGGLEAFRFGYDVVYTNTMAAGAYRGYGATQGIFALESSVNELAESLGIDPTQIREKNMLREGMKMPAYYGEIANACALDRCMARCRELFGWEEKYPVREMGDGKVRTAGVAMAMQGSCISNVDVGSATVKLADDGTFNLIIGAADMGTGCDTILAQMVAECMDCSVDDVAVFGADTDASPYDSGSYASSTTYVTGKAVELACEELKKKLCAIAAGMLGCEPEETVFEDGCVRKINTDERVTLAQISVKDQVANDIAAVATASHSSPVSPPPYMVGMVEIELDRYTGEVKILDYVAVVDCGIAINPALARIQAEGGIVQGIGHTLFENITYDENGKPVESNFMQYKIPTRLDMGHLRVEFENSYEPTGPFGAKSIGEIVINTPAPAIAHAIYRATGVWHRELPITPEKILMSMPEDDFR
ncbi:xanthine dehydrogenase family protein molybdopterin-binding subunit [Wujia chipingensis]|jgi:putative selenate reductase molybdopterin-binding subunit|uniref:Molybdopterin-dependent oxidoreductase n=1 Tax=Wujia chipingensis TaxID=2763670 RepID=A0A7G9FQ19_9FIRM|nr:molybdopterin cofactor-binding domain-containing protein [Wujia chipingensis]QNM00651.1 molybdopterin-dependent oxidoreductase [Wujia chipingensis]HCS96495.1 aldehyde oxidase [Lachnospiraceae bacterium]